MIIDGDGHLNEDLEEIASRMPREWVAGTSVFSNLFPPGDHLHYSQALRTLPGSFGRVGPKEWAEFAADTGIFRAALYPGKALAMGYITDLEWAAAVSRAYNDWLADTYLSFDDLFVGIGILPMQNPSAAAGELERIVTTLGMKGAMLPGNGLPVPYGSRFYAPVYEVANRLGCALAVHGGSYNRMGMDQMGVYGAVNAIGHPITQLIAFSDMAFNGVFDRYPNIRFGFLEAGVAWLSIAIERFERAYETHVPIHEHCLQLGPGESVRDRLAKWCAAGQITVGCEGDEPDLVVISKQLGSNVFMLSSDFPHETNKERFIAETEELKESTAMTEAERDATLWKNAASMYGLQV